MEQLYREELQIAKNQHFYRGKVRDTYRIQDKLISIASNRISAFDHILPRPIPYKGQVLNQIAAHFLMAVKDIVPVWLEDMPHPTVSVGKYCEPIRIEMVIRGYLAGHAWREYRSGKRKLCGESMPDGLRESDKFPTPIITPATKAETGHDEDISAREILDQNIVDETTWETLSRYTRQLFERGTKMAAQAGLILVDTKYEFGQSEDGVIHLIDEVHTPDSSRYYFTEGYEARQEKGEHQIQLSKEFVREWLIQNNFQGLENQVMPDMPNDFVQQISERYISLYEFLSGQKFIPADLVKNKELIELIQKALSQLN